jgi:penicillin-binding protein 1C
LEGETARNSGKKPLELLYALRLEAFQSKRASWPGTPRWSYGGIVVGWRTPASVFGRPLRDLTWAEAAWVLAVPAQPRGCPSRSDRDRLRAEGCASPISGRRGPRESRGLEAALAEPLPDQRAAASSGSASFGPRSTGGRGGSRVYSTVARGCKFASGQWWATRRPVGLRGLRNAAVMWRSGRRLRPGYVGTPAPRRLLGPTRGAYWGVRRGSRTGVHPEDFLYASLLDAGDLTPRTLIPDCLRASEPFSGEQRPVYSGAVAAERALPIPKRPFVRLLRTSGSTPFERPQTFGVHGMTRSAQE